VVSTPSRADTGAVLANLGTLLAVVVAVLVVVAVARWVGAGRSSAADPEVALDLGDLSDLEARLAEVADEERAQLTARVAARLELVVARQVPVRGIERAPGGGCARVRFADGTSVLVRGTHPGDAGVLAARARRDAVLLRSCRAQANGAHLVFTTPKGDLDLVATGLDQPD